MKYKIIFLLLLSSCVNNSYISNNSFSFSAKGFAKIEKLNLFNSENNYYIYHNKLISGTKIRLTNPENNISLEGVIKKKLKYNDFYKAIISEDIAKKLELDLNFPYIEISEIKTNKSFIAKKAITESAEKNIANKAPVVKININNLTESKNIKKSKSKNYSILVAEFYSLESAKILKKKLSLILQSSNYKLINISKKNEKSYELLMGPYNTINKLKNDYIVLNDSNFEDLDIIIND